MLESKYNHVNVEKNKALKERQARLFEKRDSSKEPFTIVIPPPNITSKLHLGHAFDLTLQDVMIRYKKLSGFDTLWVSGADHAGIATEIKVDERLRQENLLRHEIGREEFVKKCFAWKDEHLSEIHNQWEKLGLGLSYEHQHFTLDKDLNDHVNHVFIKMYEEGLIYRGEKIINWDPQSLTALSNVEVIYKDVEGFEHYFKYQSVDSDDYLIIMTTRPETMFGDGALAVHPQDERYQHLIGKYYYIPNTETKIPVIADEYVDMEKGSGVVKITMAHDPNDFEVALRHNLEPRLIMEPNATMSANKYVPEVFQGLTRYEARKLQIEMCRNKELLIDMKPIIHSVGHSERTGVVVEPYLSKQWFVKMDDLAAQTLANQKTANKVNFYPEHMEKTFNNWMDNIHDWCISRQLWWGHRIPAWYKGDEIYVGLTPPTADYVQDEDVLDTWFSSALWPLATLGFLKDSDDFKRRFPTSTLVTGYDIIFFWVARMIFQSLYLTNEIPFKDVVLHGLIRDENGLKMSKSLGNGIDPLDLLEKYGTDTLRNYLTTFSSLGHDLNFSYEKMDANWNYLNKIWNGARYVLMQGECHDLDINYELLTLTDKWILNKLNAVIEEVTRNMENYEYGVVGKVLYDFVWNDYCNWYLEFSKVNLQAANDVKINTIKVLNYVLKEIIILLHPFTPFITQEIYQQMGYDGFVVENTWPIVDENHQFSSSIVIDNVIEMITKIRTLRLEYKLNKDFALKIVISGQETDELQKCEAILQKFCKTSDITFTDSLSTKQEWISYIIGNCSLNVLSEGLVDKEAEIVRLNEILEKTRSEIKRSRNLLNNEGFLKKAPDDKINLEKEKLAKYESELESLEVALKKLS